MKAEEYLYGSSVNGVDGKAYFYRKYKKWYHFWFDVPYQYRPNMNLEGDRLLDVGCGHGAFVVHAASDGAHATGIDLTPAKFRVGQEESRHLIEGGGGSAQFYNADAAVFRAPELFDLMISYETFEHMENLPDVLANLYTLLKPGGYFYVAWGGMWPSVFGGHYWLQKHFLGIPIPWSHRMFTKANNRPGVNQLGYEDYVAIIKNSPFEIVSWSDNVGSHWGYKAFRSWAKIPGLRDAFTQNCYVVLRRSIIGGPAQLEEGYMVLDELQASRDK